MCPETRNIQWSQAQPHPLAELLRCSPAANNLLNSAAQSLNLRMGELVFRQAEQCRGLYVIASGQFLRQTDRLSTRLVLGMSRAGDLVELAAALGNIPHTYSLGAQTAGLVVLLPLNTLHQAFEAYPPLRLQLLQELAREVSRGYVAGSQIRLPRACRIARASSESRPPG